MPRYISILFALPLLLSCNESAEAKLLAQKKAEAEFEAELKTEYEKMFGEPISDFEFLTKKVDYYKIEDYIIPPKHIPIMSMTRTSTGALARFEDYHTSKEQEIELDILEWLDFVNALHKCNINEWKRHYYGKPSEKENISDFKKSWNLEIHRSDYNFNFYNGQDSYPHNWDEFMKVMTDFEAKIKSKAGAK